MKPERAGQSTQLLLDLVELLDSEELGYAVIGAMAAAVHGVVRASMDADALLHAGIPRLRAIKSEIEARGYRTELRLGDPDDPIAAVLQVTDSFANRVDLLSGLRGMDQTAFTRTVSVPFGGASLRFVSLEDFIAMKLFAGGPRDLDDARRSAMVSRATLDQRSLREIAKGFGPETVNRCAKLLTQLDSDSD